MAGEGGGGIPQHYGPRGRSGLQLPVLVRGRHPCRGRGFRQDHQLRVYLPGRRLVVDVCVTHPLSSSAVAAEAWGTGSSAEAKDALKRDKYGRTGTGVCRVVPLSHDTYGRAAPSAFALLHELVEFAAATGAVSKNIFMENNIICAARLSTTPCRGITRQVLALAPLRARLDGRTVLPRRPVPTDGLA